ncbi:Bacteriophytochrome cph2 [Roseibium album]|nr:Bacteriophytochrome cph2 [Roseibium album]
MRNKNVLNFGKEFKITEGTRVSSDQTAASGREPFDLDLPQSNSWAAHNLWFQQVAQYISDPVYLKDRASRFVMANDALMTHFSDRNLSEVIGKTDLELHEHEIAQRFYRAEQTLMESDQAMVGHEEFVYLPGGEKQWLSTTKVPLRDGIGNVVGLFGIGHDITTRKKSELLREGQGKVLELIAAGLPLERVLSELLLLLEEQFVEVKASILTLGKDGKHVQTCAAPSLPDEFNLALDNARIRPSSGVCGTAAFGGTTVHVAEIESDPLWADHKYIALTHGIKACTTSPIRSLTGHVLGAITMYSSENSSPNELQADLVAETARIAAIAIERDLTQSRILFLAEHDPLTNLSNRNLLERRIDELIRDNHAGSVEFTLVFVDLDRFKAINDSLGHSAGDKVLKIVAERLVYCLRPEDMVARFGGDEFVILMKRETASADRIKPVLERIQAAVSEPVIIENQAFQICSSLGISRYPQDGEDASTLLKHADDAMYEAKSLGRNCYRFYSAALAETDALKLSLIQDIRTGIREEQFFLEYQPQFDLKSGRMTGVEALLRWNHPKHGRIPPGDFIATAEESGLISELGTWVLFEACKQGNFWQQSSSNHLVVSVNVSAHQFFGGGLIERIEEALTSSGLSPEQLELELTESSLMKDPDLCVETMNRLRDMGVRIALDDFGTGYSSLSALRLFPLNKLKIDSSFIRNIDNGSRELGIARAIVALGHELGMRVIAEGVETESQLNHLKALDCNDVQGFLTGRPMPSPMVETLLAQQSAGGLH